MGSFDIEPYRSFEPLVAPCTTRTWRGRKWGDGKSVQPACTPRPIPRFLWRRSVVWSYTSHWYWRNFHETSMISASHLSTKEQSEAGLFRRRVVRSEALQNWRTLRPPSIGNFFEKCSFPVRNIGSCWFGGYFQRKKLESFWTGVWEKDLSPLLSFVNFKSASVFDWSFLEQDGHATRIQWNNWRFMWR